jgi:cytochrome c oxidase accessory protein FixG
MALDLHPSRLGTTNEDGSRAFVYPADVRGKWRERRNPTHLAMLVIFLIAPWLQYDGEQMVLIDVVHRRFIFFGHIFWSHDVPVLFLLVLLGFVTVLFVTTFWGRVWCGWACPQTVFIDAVFRRIERWVEGSHIVRRRRDSEPWLFDSIWRKILKWAAYFAVSMSIAHSFIAYFAGAKSMLEMMSRPPNQNFGYFLVVFSITAWIAFDFGWFREQFCIIICPYGRLQSVITFDTTKVIKYDSQRGEPRRGDVPKGEKTGDCVNCFRCVSVCPTGIDIRRGLQMECISCTGCIDACDEVMTKVGKPVGLIRYDSLKGEVQGKKWRPEAVVYAVAFVGLLSTFGYVLYSREPLDYEFLRGGGEPFTLTKEGTQEFVFNHFQVQISSQTRDDVTIEFKVSSDLEGRGVRLTTPFRPLPVKTGEIIRTGLFIRFPKSMVKSGVAKLTVLTEAQGPNEKTMKQHEIRLVGPFM